MKYSICLGFLMMPLLVFAQNYPGQNQKQMQEMMQKAQEMQTCMKNIDQGKLQEFEQKARQIGQEIEALCAAGNRSAALKTAMSFKNEIDNNQSLQEMKKCGEMMKGFMPEFSEIAKTQAKNKSKDDICN